jgi:hypothetical protein
MGKHIIYILLFIIKRINIKHYKNNYTSNIHPNKKFTFKLINPPSMLIETTFVFILHINS